MLEKLKALLTSDDAPTKKEIAERRREVRAEIEEVEDQIRRLEHDPAEGLEEAKEVGDRARHRRDLEDRLEDLKALDKALGERQQEAEHRERVRRAQELKEEAIPELAEELKEAKATYRRLGRKLSKFIAETSGIRSKLNREGTDFYLSRETVAALREIEEDLPGHHATALDNLEPPAEKEDEKRIVQKVGGETEFHGPWSDREIRRHGGGVRVTEIEETG